MDNELEITTATKREGRKSVGPEHMVVLHNILDNLVVGVESEVREKEDDDAEASSSDWSSDDDVAFERTEHRNGASVKVRSANSNLSNESNSEEHKVKNEEDEDASVVTVKTKNEVISTKVAEVFDFDIKDDDEFIPAGKVLSSMRGSTVVVVQGNPVGETLVQGTVMCTAEGSTSRRLIGSIDELFGPVNMPHYIIRNAAKDLCVDEGTPVVAVRRSMKILDPALRIAMQHQKGSDASNLYDEEAEDKEFSDDEAEREHKRKLKRQQGGDKRKRDISRPRGDRSRNLYGQGSRGGTGGAGFDYRKRNRRQNNITATISSRGMGGTYDMSAQGQLGGPYNHRFAAPPTSRFGALGGTPVGGIHDSRYYPRPPYASAHYGQQHEHYRHPSYAREPYQHSYSAYSHLRPPHVRGHPSTTYAHMPRHAMHPRGRPQYFSNTPAVTAAAVAPGESGYRPGVRAGTWVPPRFPPAPRSFAPPRGNAPYAPDGSNGRY